MFRRVKHSVLPITSVMLIGLLLLLTFTTEASATFCWALCWSCEDVPCEKLKDGTPCVPGGFWCPGWSCQCGAGMYGARQCLSLGGFF